MRRRWIYFALTIFLFLFSVLIAKAETYYSRGSGTVTIVTNWNTLASGGGTSPANFNGTNTWIIQPGHNMTMSGSWTVGAGGNAAVIIRGSLTISSSYIVTVTGTLNVNGLLKNAGTYATGSPVTASGGINIIGEYEHARNGGTIPTAVWNVSSNCNITGITLTAPTIPSATQPFGNFTWNCPLQNPDQNIFLGGQLTAINGNFNMINTNGTLSSLKLGDNLPGHDLTVNGDYVQTGGRLHIAFASARKMTINGDFNLEYGVFYITANAGTGILDIEGNFYMTGGYFNFINYVLAEGTLNVRGNCSITGGEVRMSKSVETGTNILGGYATVGGTLTTAPGSTWDISLNQLTVHNLIHNGAISINSTDPNVNGSLIVTGTITGTGTVTYNRSLPDDTFSHYISSPVGSLKTTISNGVSSWNELTGQFTPASITSASASGRGYAVNTTASSLAFTGSVVNSAGPITATSPYSDCTFSGSSLASYGARTEARDTVTAYGGGGWNLLGNPFTSAMIVSTFIDVNNGDPGVASDGSFDPNYEAVYIYDGTAYSFKGYEIPGFSNAEGDAFGYDYLQAGQGFFVRTHCNTSRFTFTPPMQTHRTTAPFTKSAVADDPWPGLRLKVKYGNTERSVMVVYNSSMTTGLDPGYDVGHMSGDSEVEIYTTLAAIDKSVNFARQALPVTAAETIIVPVGVDTELGGGVTFSAFTIPLGNNKFWLEDRTVGIFTDLGLKNYTVSLPAKTYGTGRFYLHASTNMPTGSDDLTPEDDAMLRIWFYDRKIIIEGQVSEGSLCELFDQQGRKLLEQHLSDGELNTIDSPAGLSGVIMARVTDGQKVVVRKLVIP